MKRLLIIALVLLGAYLTEPGFTNSLGGLVLLGAGLWGGYIDGVATGRRQVLGGKSENPIK
uniref:Uncharacterized protein n=1 Tax=Salmonella phage PMBT35 TaxID=3137287 RepID=A0AAU8BUY9_9VIRU